MKQLIKSFILSFALMFLFAGSVFAANSTSIRLQQPASPTNKDSFNITFVALDTNSSQPVSVKCYKKGPSDGAFSAFGSQINLSNGGNTDNCVVTPSVMNQGAGTYQFYAKVVTGSTTPTSSTVSVDFNNSGPGTPDYNGKDKNACVQTIKFTTANDSGKTVKVEIYRSSSTSFDANSGTRIATVNVGSNEHKEYDDNIGPNCDTTYYYAVRAFDIYGNGSGIVGDSNTTVTTTETNATPTSGALASGTNGNSVGESTEEVTENQEPQGGVLGTENTEGAQPAQGENKNQEQTSVLSSLLSNNIWVALVIILIAGGVIYYVYRKYYNK